jgi:hypothetical protein
MMKESGTECAAVFDIGTRAARVLVGPKNPPAADEWDDKLFSAVGFVTAIGTDVSPVTGALNVDESPGLWKLVRFINDTMYVLRSNGVKDSNVVAIGTEVFRSMPPRNLAEVTGWIKEKTGITLHIIDGKAEANLSFAAAEYTQVIGLEQKSPYRLSTDDRFLLIDQGGGSTEISFLRSRADDLHRDSKPSLGTSSLRRMFFGGITDGGKDPKSDFTPIQEQYLRMLPHIQRFVDGFDLQPGGFKLAYGLGTAIADCVRGGSNARKHNMVLTTEAIVAVEQKRRDDLGKRFPSVAALWNALEQLRQTDDDLYVKTDKEALFLYGLPVFRMILQKAGLTEVRLCGYPLRFGAFFVWHKYHLDWDFKVRAAD